MVRRILKTLPKYPSCASMHCYLLKLRKLNPKELVIDSDQLNCQLIGILV